MSLPITPIAYNPPTIAQEAAAKAAAGSGKRKVPSSVLNGLAKKSRKMAYEFQEAMEKNVKRKLDSMSGPDDNRKRGLKVAQFIPGKGLEIGGVQEHNDAAIYCSLGLKGDKLENAIDKTFSTMSGKKISMDFAFKLICKPELSSKEKKSRVTAINCFRHVNPDSYNYKKTGTYESPTGTDQYDANRNWHTTLGPDASHIRRGVQGLVSAGSLAGTWRGSATGLGGLAKHYDSTSQQWFVNSGTSKVANSLLSPYRYPNDMEMMYSRVNRQVLENFGFALNKWRFVGSQDAKNTTVVGDTLDTELEYKWRSPSKSLMNFPETANTTDDKLKNSFPAQVNNSFKKLTGTGVIEATSNEEAFYYEYHSQFGPGKLNYQFSNDGTNPVCIDICVVGIKKGETVSLELLKNIFSFNYSIAKYANNSRMNLEGYQAPKQPLASGVGSEDIDFDFGTEEWHNDAKLPFIPSDCFKNPQSYLKAVDYPVLGNPNPNANASANRIIAYLEQGKKNPFKLVKRDQFIVSSGSTRAWNTTLPSIKYRPQLYEDVEYPLETYGSVAEDPSADSEYFATTADEYTFVLLVGASGMSKPMEELYPAQTLDQDGGIRTPEILKSTISDHEPSSCNVSVVGTYTETVMPAYPEDISDRTFINGRLTLPYFTETPDSDKINPSIIDPPEYPDRLSTVDIATQMQVVRTTDSGISGVGAINTQVGA